MRIKKRFNPLESKLLVFIPILISILIFIIIILLLYIFSYQNFSGIILPKGFVEVRAEINGVIKRDFVKDGEIVNSNQVLIELDKEETISQYKIELFEKEKYINELEILREKYRLLNEKLKLFKDYHNKEIEKKKKLAKNEIIPKFEYFKSLNDYRSIILEYEIMINDISNSIINRILDIKKLEASISNLENIINKTQIKSPAEGIVLYRNFNDDEKYSDWKYFSSSLQFYHPGRTVMKGDVLYTIVYNEDIFVKFEIPESYINKIKEDNIKIIIESLPFNKYGSFDGKINNFNFSAIGGKFYGFAEIICTNKIFNELKYKIFGSKCVVKIKIFNNIFLNRIFNSD